MEINFTINCNLIFRTYIIFKSRRTSLRSLCCLCDTDSSFIRLTFRQVHSLFQIEFTTRYDLVFPFMISTTLSLPQGHPVASYIFFVCFPSLLSSLSFSNLSQQAPPTQDVTNPVSLTCFSCLQDIRLLLDPL